LIWSLARLLRVRAVFQLVQPLLDVLEQDLAYRSFVRQLVCLPAIDDAL